LTLSVAICTCDREQELLSCVASVIKAKRYATSIDLELAIIDDGVLSQLSNERIRRECTSAAIDMLYYQKHSKGLYSSRLEAVARTRGDIILFLDDDVILEPDYLSEVEKAFLCQGVGGFSGIDTSLNPPSWRMLVYQFFFLHCSTGLGELSVTGFNGSVTRWPRQRNPFETKFFVGFNMAFRRSAIQDLPVLRVFEGYSVGEDLFISLFASKRTHLIVNPAARLVHRQTSIARDNARRVSRSIIVNQFFLLEYFYPRTILRILLFVWSAIGLLVKDVYDTFFLLIRGRSGERRQKVEELKGKLDGIRELLRLHALHGYEEVKSACPK
jgi:glycosyltransferase involved in cell wall biosynthesis